MIHIMKHTAFRAVCLSSWVVLAAACSRETAELPVPDGQISVFTAVSRSGEAADGEGEEVKACLLFWMSDDYHNMLKENFSAEPFLVSLPEEKIDYYNVESAVPYNTRHSYPLGDQPLHVCGFAPASLTTEDNYKTLIIPEAMQDGKTDFLSGDGNRYRVGKTSVPFVVDDENDYVNKNKDKQLEFCHLTSKIVVSAKRSENMLGRIGVRNIKVTLHGQQVPTKLQWEAMPDRITDDENSKEWGGYLPQEPTEAKSINLASKSKDPLVQTMEQRVDSCYVWAGNEDHFYPSSGTDDGNVEGEIEMSMDVSAELAPIVGNTIDWNQSQTQTWKELLVAIKTKTGNILKMGYKYSIIITFNINDIRLQGIEMEWDEGGTHYIPITPKPNKENQS